MDLFEAILNRRSIRKYTNHEIPEEIIEKLLRSAMYAPSAMNYQPWHFVILNKKESLVKAFKAIPHAEMLQQARAGIIVCGDNIAEKNVDYIVQNCSAATQNILLAAHGLGLGGVWIGIYPVEETIKSIKEFFSLPKHIVPVALVSLGFPAENIQSEERYSIEKIHHNKW